MKANCLACMLSGLLLLSSVLSSSAAGLAFEDLVAWNQWANKHLSRTDEWIIEDGTDRIQFFSQLLESSRQQNVLHHKGLDQSGEIDPETMRLNGSRDQYFMATEILVFLTDMLREEPDMRCKELAHHVRFFINHREHSDHKIQAFGLELVDATCFESVRSHTEAACPDIDGLEGWPNDFDYIPLPTVESLQKTVPHGLPSCFEELALYARAGRPEGEAMLAGLGDDAESQALRYLIETPVEEMSAVTLARHMFDAGEPVLWDAAFFALGSGRLQAEDEASRQELAGLVPRAPGTALRYASAMNDVTGDGAYWAGVTSTILMESPDVLRDDGLGRLRLSPDLARLDDWLDAQSPDELAVFVERLDVEKRLELPGFLEPDQLTIVTFARLLSEFYDQGVEPPQAWVGYFEDNLADWMLTHLPEELMEADVWDRSHDDLLRNPGEIIDALGDVFSAMGPLQVFPYLGVLAETESPVLVRIAYGIRMMIVPSHAHFLDLVDSGVSPVLLADALDRNQIQTLVMTGLNSERSGALFELIEHLDCHHFDDSSRMLAEFLPDSTQPPDGSVLVAWLARAASCE